MNVQRAQEISFSPIMANVSYKGKQIYIEHVDQQFGSATIHPLDEPNNKQNVALSSLVEQS